MNARKVARWLKTFDLYDPAERLYRRENWVYRKQMRWLNEQEVRELVRRLSKAFDVPVIRSYVTSNSELASNKPSVFLAYFMVDDVGKHWFLFRKLADYVARWSRKAVTDKCEKVWLDYYDAPKGSVSSSAVLHEFAHYLCFYWWGHAPHDAVFSAVSEVTHEWFSRSRPKMGIKRRMRVRKEVW